MKFTNWSITFLFGFALFAMPICAFIFGELFLSADTLFGKIISGLVFIYCLIIAPILLIKIGRQWFSYFLVDERGITNKIFFFKSKDIFIAWDEIVDIAIKPIGKGQGVYSHNLYVCKMPLDEYWHPSGVYRHVKKISAYKDSYGLGHDENHFTIDYSKKLLDEVSKYVDRERIRNIDTVIGKVDDI